MLKESRERDWQSVIAGDRKNLVVVIIACGINSVGIPVSSWAFWACVTNGGLDFDVDVMQKGEGVEP
jgi:hypothetical protein